MFSPCPFSKDYKIPSKQAWSLLKGFYSYRLLLACLFLVFFYSRLGEVLIHSSQIKLYLYASGAYFILALGSWSLLLRKKLSYASQAQAAIFTDIFLITLIMHAAGGISSGVGALMLVTTAAGGLLIGGRCAMLFAAIASLFVFAEQAYNFRIEGFNNTYYSYAGMLGAGFFSLAFLSYMLAKRTEQSERLSSQREEAIISLEELNQYIIQNMPSGIIIIDQQQNVTSYNEASPRLLGLNNIPSSLPDVSNSLAHAFINWQADSSNNFVNISSTNQIELQVHFNDLPTRHARFFMITLEDTALYNQRVQKSKLASLGLLSANMAHEIRNPLGAISHAGQLLSESPDLPAGDLRLTEIIQQHALRMNSIIEDILQLSRRKDSQLMRINLADWLVDYLAMFESESPSHQDKFYLSLEANLQDILFDPGHLTQILNNLCENAIKYGSAQTMKIQIRVSSSLYQPCIDIVDYGKVIPQSSIKHLFEPFFTTSNSGTGLGLYISSELAELNQAMLTYHAIEAEKIGYFRLCLATAKD